MKKCWSNRKKLLTKEEFDHLELDAGCLNKDAFQRTIDKHEEWRMARPGDPDPCWECRNIAIKLNMKAKGATW